MAADSYYLIGFFSYFGMESQKPDIGVLFDVLRSLQTESPGMDVSHFEDDARQLLDGMTLETLQSIQGFLDDDDHGSQHFMNGWRVAHMFDVACGGGSRTLH